ncbi:MAG: Na(+)-translocating NADH-quinone reductase subunit C [Chromatiales bacterium]
MSASVETPTKTLLVALGVSLVCSVVVAAAAVGLRPRQAENELHFQQRNILAAAGLYDPGRDVGEQFEQIEVRIVDLATGEYIEDLDPNDYDAQAALRNPAQSDALDKSVDIANIKRRERYAKVYLLRDGDEIETIILPIRGYGLWSTMYGFIALEADGNTVSGLSFYEHGETPGLGDKIEDPRWLGLWPGKKVYDAAGEPQLQVIRGQAAADDPHSIDGMAGATLTGRGVTNMLAFWLGGQGYGPYLRGLEQTGSDS